MRVVVNLVGEPAHGKLAESRFVERPFLPGGEQNMYELAFAAASLGYEVELRGWLHRPAFDLIAADTPAAPSVGLDARPPESGDLVVVPEGWRDPLEYGRLLLSPARVAVYVLAAPGLFGWPFCGPGWSPPDPVTVPLDAVARPEHFQAMDQLGVTLLTHSPGISAAAEAAGVSCAFVGTGRPRLPGPSGAGERTIDAVGLLANRWAPLVRDVAAGLDDFRVELLDELPNQAVLERFAHAKVLLWPSRIEGHATIPWEARSMGCVPVALSTNRFAVGLSERTGAVVVDTVEEIAPAVRALLADPGRWAEFSQRAVETAPDEVRWDEYLGRVKRFLDSVTSPSPREDAYAGIGAALGGWIDRRSDEAQRSLEDLAAELVRLREDRDALHYEAAYLREDRDRLAALLQDRPEMKIVRRLGDAARRRR